MLFDTVPVGGLLFAWCTLMAVAPIRRPRPLATLSWLSSCAPSEVPYLFGYIVLATSVVPAIVTGDEAAVGGPVALALALLTIAGLGVVARRASLARPSLAAAFRTELGAGWRDQLDPRLRVGLRQRPPWLRILLAPWPMRPRAVAKAADVAYGELGQANQLDVYRHRSQPAHAPTLIHLHGGRFRWGKKSREARPLLHHLASRGWTCISANYRLSATPSEGFPGHLVDVKRVIAWAKANAQGHGIDPHSIFLSGSSAGAHLTAMAVLTPNDPRYQPGFEPTDTSVAGAIGFYGYYGPLGDDEHGPPTTPLAYDAADAPPFLVVHGTNDTYTSAEGARALAEHLRASSRQPVVLAELPGAQHSFDLFHSVRYEAVVDAVEAFAAWVCSTPAQARTKRRSPDQRRDLEQALPSTASAHSRSHRRALAPKLTGAALVALLGATTVAACGDDDGDVRAAPSTDSMMTSPTSTTLTTTTTPPEDSEHSASPSEVAGEVAAAWFDGDHATVRALAEPAAAELLVHLEPGVEAWTARGCEGTTGSTYCQFDSHTASLTLRVAHPGVDDTDAALVTDSTLTATGDAVALWPFTTDEEASAVQRNVDQGRSPWHLESDAVVVAFAEAVLGYEDAFIDDAASEGETTRVTDGSGRAADVAAQQPARTGDGGIWAVVPVTDP